MHRVVENEHDRTMLFRLLRERPMPFTVEVVKGRRRSVEQNRLQRLWMNEVAAQMQDRTPEEVRGYCKLRFGVPILRAENELFCAKYDAIVKPLPYDQKLAIMMEPLDMPVTRLMTTAQNTRYLDAIYQHFTEQGLILTMPDPQHAEMEGHNGGPPLDKNESQSDAVITPASDSPAVSEIETLPTAEPETAGASHPVSKERAPFHVDTLEEAAAGDDHAASDSRPRDAVVPAAVPPLSEKDKATLRRYAAHLEETRYERDLRRGSGAFLDDHNIVEETPIYEAALAIFRAHLKRVTGRVALQEWVTA